MSHYLFDPETNTGHYFKFDGEKITETVKSVNLSSFEEKVIEVKTYEPDRYQRFGLEWLESAHLHDANGNRIG